MRAPFSLTGTTDRERVPFGQNRLLQGLALGYFAIWTVGAIDPVYPFDWFLENLLVVALALLLVVTGRLYQLSDVSYLLIFAFLCFHTLGAHFTYAEVPLGYWLQEAWSLPRNPYDRVVHFLFGLLFYYPLKDVLSGSAGLRGGWLVTMTLCVLLAASVLYEIIEWIVALLVQPEAAYAYLGTQGDPFDAQKDSALAAAGAVLAAVVTAGWRRLGPASRRPLP
ncbi:MAG: DUF2238 domain-containing protein [Alphaproteobacteria bacterium]